MAKVSDEIPELTAEERVAFRQQMADKKAADEATAVAAKAVEEAAAAAAVEAQEAAAVAEREAAVEATKQEAQKVARKANPKQFCGLLVEGLTEPDYVDNPAGDKLERTLSLGGVVYEHVSEDVDGVWVYKHLG